jgi:ABC-type multidrug transport system fused ATPase/permease subunit
MLCTALLEIVEVSSLSPFIAVAANPNIVNHQPLLAFFYRFGGFDKQSNGIINFLILLGIAIFIVIIIITAFRTIVMYIVSRFTANRRYTLSVRLFRQYLFQPYQFFLNHNSGELSKNLLSEVNSVIDSVLRPAIDAFTHGMEALALLVFLIILNPLVALLAAVIFGGLYSGLYVFVRPRLARYGKETREANRLRYKISAEAFGGIKDIKILEKEIFFNTSYGQAAKRFADLQVANHILSAIPGRIMHSMAIGFAIALMVVLLAVNGTLTEILPLLSIYAFAVLRLMPNLQHVFQSAASIRYSTATVDALYNDMTTLIPAPKISSSKKKSVVRPEVLPFTRDIELKGIQFSYPASREPVLNGIDLTINRNTAIAFAGTTGCGKTTLVDVLIGLLEPSGGSINVDGSPVIGLTNGKDSRPSITLWQRNFGYVPQQIYLSDNTVAANIAFGIPEDLLDSAAVERAAKVANLHEFIINELPEGYNTIVGERGIRLSGGQRQRIGIARALYHDPNILVMDEATSALDSVTEDAVMEAIHNLMHTKTIIIIAHRLSTIKECDVIYLMEHGRIIAQGTYEELLENNSKFRAMAKINKN